MKRIALTLVLGLIGSMGTANAIVAFTSFAPGDVYQTNIGYTIAGPTSGSPQRVAMQFTSNASGVVDTIRLATFYGGGNTALTAVLYNDNGSDLLGSAINSWSYSDSNAAAHISTITNTTSSTVLSSGQKYWLELFTLTNGNHAWNRADPSIPLGRLTFSTNDGTSYSYFNNVVISAFEVTVVPEPASMIALGLGASALLARRRKKS